jgi:hypothetical protein
MFHRSYSPCRAQFCASQSCPRRRHPPPATSIQALTAATYTRSILLAMFTRHAAGAPPTAIPSHAAPSRTATHGSTALHPAALHRPQPRGMLYLLGHAVLALSAADGTIMMPAADDASNAPHTSAGFDATDAAASPADFNANGALIWPAAPAATNSLHAAFAPHVASTATAMSGRTAPQPHHPRP